MKCREIWSLKIREVKVWRKFHVNSTGRFENFGQLKIQAFFYFEAIEEVQKRDTLSNPGMNPNSDAVSLTCRRQSRVYLPNRPDGC